MRISASWHDLLGFSSTLLRDMSIGCDVVMKHQGQFNRIEQQSLDQSFPSVKAIAEAVKKSLIPDMVRIQAQTRANDLAWLLDAVGYDLHSPPSRPLAQPVTHIMHPSRLQDLRNFLEDDRAAFKHTQQALAVELIASKNPSILLIGPTGASFSNLARSENT